MNYLRLRRNRLLGPYIGFVLTLFSCSAMAGTGQIEFQLGLLILSLLIFSIPVIILNISLHKAIKRVSPYEGSTGLKQTLFSCLLLTPIEAAVVLPAINVTIANRILRSGDPPHNKVKNENARKTGADAAKARRPF